MLYRESNAFRVCEADLGKVKKVSRPVSKFIVHVLELWLSPCRCVFMGMQRRGTKTEKSYQRMFVAFLIRDGKQHSGLEDCQARSKQKLHTHFNMAFTVVSLWSRQLIIYLYHKNSEAVSR